MATAVAILFALREQRLRLNERRLGHFHRSDPRR